ARPAPTSPLFPYTTLFRSQIAFALPLAFLAYTGLETVANLAEEIRRPGRDLPRSLFLGIGAVVLVTVLIALVGLSAFPAPHGTRSEEHTSELQSLRHLVCR